MIFFFLEIEPFLNLEPLPIAFNRPYKKKGIYDSFRILYVENPAVTTDIKNKLSFLRDYTNVNIKNYMTRVHPVRLRGLKPPHA